MVKNLKSLRNRAGLSQKQLADIVTRSAGILNIGIEREGALEIASRSRGTPRIANALLRRVRDFAQVKGSGSIDTEIAQYALEALGVDRYGLDEIDNKLLCTIIDIRGDYAFVKYDATGVVSEVAIALLPFGADVGDKLKFEVLSLCKKSCRGAAAPKQVFVTQGANGPFALSRPGSRP